MIVSVIIPSFNGAQKLPGLLQCLKAQIIKPREVIVVVDGSTDNTVEVLKRAILSFPGLQYIMQENAGRATARNRGVTEATGDLLVFFDDDMLPLNDCLEQHIKHHEQNPGTVLTGGLIESVDEDSKDLMRYRASLSKKWNQALKPAIDGKLQESKIFLMAANCSIPKTLFKQLGGFDGQLTDAEDFDLAVRASKMQIPLYFKEKAFAWHADKITCRSYIKRQRQYAKAQNFLIRQKPWLSTEGYINAPLKPTGFKKQLFGLFVANLWIEMIDKDLLQILPKKLRYKLYDLVITANGIYFPEELPL